MTSGARPDRGKASAASDAAANDLDFEAAMERLESIVHELESGEVGLERAMQLFEEGLALGKQCDTLLDAATARVEKLLQTREGALQTVDFATEEDGGS